MASPQTRPPVRAPQRPPQRDLSLLYEEEDTGGPFQVDAATLPDGMSYEWRRVTYAGKEDVRHQARAHRRHWTPVPKKRHPEIVKSLKLTPEGQLPRVRVQAKKKYNIQVAEPDEAAAGSEGAE
jgi:hypothetical protein